MKDSETLSLEQIRAFLYAGGEVEFAARSREETYQQIEETLPPRLRTAEASR